jgi:serine O-acetyltransferase
MIDAIKGDIEIYARDGDRPWWTCPGFWAVLPYRIGAAAQQMPNRPSKWACLLAYRALGAPWRLFKGVHIPRNAEIGPGLRLPHPQNILIAPGAKLGRDCSVYHDVTLGRGSRRGVPILGDRVMLFPGSRILGGITIGDDARVGANAVVQQSISPGASVTLPRPRVIPSATTRRAVARQARFVERAVR